MIAYLLLIASLPADPGPYIPPGTNSLFQRTVAAMQTHLEKGQFSEAAKYSDRLPSMKIRYSLDESNVPKARRGEIRKALQDAIAAWKTEIRALEVTPGKNPHVQFSFAETLPPNPDSNGPAGAVFLTSPGLGDPPAEGVIALHRGEAKEPATVRDLAFEFAFGIGTVLGLERMPPVGPIMGRLDRHYVVPPRVLPGEAHLAEQNIGVSNKLRDAVAKKRRLTASRPQIFMTPSSLASTDSVLQGTVVPFSFQVTNRGVGDLGFFIVPDCGCFTIKHATTVKPGQTDVVRVLVDTSTFSGDILKYLYVYSNDVEQPVKQFPVEVRIEPRFRFIRTEPGRTILLSDQGAKTDIFLEINQKKDFKVKGVSLSGTAGHVTFEPWAGELADPENSEGPRLRKGYKFSVLLGTDTPNGRLPLTFTIETDDPDFPKLHYGLHVQRGIVALPNRLYLGNLDSSPRMAHFYVTRPESPFKITRIESSSPHLKATAKATKGEWEYKVTVEYDGKANVGFFEPTLTIHTDDPSQPTITVPVQGVVK